MSTLSTIFGTFGSRFFVEISVDYFGVLYIEFTRFFQIIHIIHIIHKACEALYLGALQTLVLFEIRAGYAIILLVEIYEGGLLMSNLNLVRDCNRGSVCVSNYFIDEMLSEANDAQIKVYLFLLRQTEYNRPTNINDIADKFNHTEREVCRSLRYWEKKNVLSLDYDINGTIVGIRLHEPGENIVAEGAAPFLGDESANVVTSLSDTTYSASVNRMTEAPVAGEAHMADVSASDQKRSIDTSVAMSSLRESKEKPAYTLDELKEFKKRPEIGQLIFVAETYLKKTLCANEMRSLKFYIDELEFSSDLIDYLLQYCTEHNKTTYSYMDKLAKDWYENDINTVKQAKAYTVNFNAAPAGYTGNKAADRMAQNVKPLEQTKKRAISHNIEKADIDFEQLERKLLMQ